MSKSVLLAEALILAIYEPEWSSSRGAWGSSPIFVSYITSTSARASATASKKGVAEEVKVA